MSREQTIAAGGAPAYAWAPVTRRLGYDALFEAFAAGAAERDVKRTPIFAETRRLLECGFGAVRLGPPAGAERADRPDDPVRPEGGAGEGPLPLGEFFALVRDLAKADPNIAHVFRNHFFAVETHRRTPDDPFSARVLALAAGGAMFGVAFSEANGKPAGGQGHQPGMVLEPDGDGYRISGRKIYSTGNMYADYLFATAVDGRSGEVRNLFVPTKAAGVRLDDDWDGFGQKLTGSGTTVFDRVAVGAGDLYRVPPRDETIPPLYGFTFHQIYLTTVISGIVERILHDAVAVIRGRGRNYYHALAEHPSQEPELLSVIGRIAAHRAALVAVTERASAALDRAWAGVDTDDARALSLAASIAAAEAKVVVDETAATLAGLLIDVSSGSGVSTLRALDRHWRNIKVIAAHNPRVYKERILGDHYVNGALPPTGAFF